MPKATFVTGANATGNIYDKMNYKMIDLEKKQFMRDFIE